MTVDTHDEFLYQLREPPRPEFAEALKARISQEPHRSPTARKVRIGLVVLLAALVIAACAAPQTRMPILRATETVITQSREAVTRFLLVTRGAPPHVVMVLPCGEGRDVQVEVLSLREAQKRVPFQIRVPTWVPEGLEMNPVTLVPPEGFGDWVIDIGWGGSSSGAVFPGFGKAPLSLRIEGPGAKDFWVRCINRLQEVAVAETKEITSSAESEVPWFRIDEKGNVPRIVEVTPLPVKPPEFHTLEINGRPANLTVIREATFYPYAVLEWVQEEGNIRYRLTANLNMVSLEDLIRVAETIR